MKQSSPRSSDGDACSQIPPHDLEDLRSCTVIHRQLCQPRSLASTLVLNSYSHSSPNAHRCIPHSNRVPSSAATGPPPQLCLFEPGHLYPTPTASLRARALVPHPNYVFSSPSARLPLRPCAFEPGRLDPTSTVSLRARTLIFHLHHVSSHMNTRVPSRLCAFEPEPESFHLTVSTRARALAFHLGRDFLSPSFISMLVDSTL